MTTLQNRPDTALLVVGVQNGVVGEAYERDAVVANIGRLVAQARRGDRCVHPAGTVETKDVGFGSMSGTG